MATTRVSPKQSSDRFLTADNFSSTGSIHTTHIYDDGVIVLDHCESSSDYGPLAPTSSGGSYVTSPAHSGFGTYCKSFTGQSNLYNIYGIASGDWTVDFWVNFPDVTGTRNLVTIKNSDLSGDAATAFILRCNTNKMYFYDRTGSEVISSDAGAATLVADTWYHLALTYTKSTHKLTIWLNGSKYLEYATAVKLSEEFDSYVIGQSYSGKRAFLDEIRVRQGVKYTTSFSVPTSQAVLGDLVNDLVSMRYTYNLPTMSTSKIGGAKVSDSLGVGITNAGYLKHTLEGGFGISIKELDNEIESTMTAGNGITMEETTTERVVESTTTDLWPLNGTLANSVSEGSAFPAVTYEYAQDNNSTLIKSNLSSDLLSEYPLTYTTFEWYAKATDTETFSYIGTSDTGYGIGFNGTTVKYGSMETPEEMINATGTYEAPKDDFHHFAITYISNYGIMFYYDCQQIGFQYLDDPFMNPNYDPYSENGDTGLTGHITYGADFYLRSVKISDEPKYTDATITLDKKVYVSADTTVLATKAELATKQDALPNGTTGYFLQKTNNGVAWVEVEGGGGGGSITVDQEYDASSSHAQSGVAVAQGIAAAVSGKADSSSLASVATTGSYNDLSDKPTIPSAVIVDQSYDPTSTSAQSGTAVAEALSGKQTVLTAGSGIVINNNTISASAPQAYRVTSYTGVTGDTVTSTTAGTITRVYKNGTLLTLTTDYTVAENVITFTTALVSSDKILVETYGGIAKIIEITQADYDDLETANALDSTAFYLIKANQA